METLTGIDIHSLVQASKTYFHVVPLAVALSGSYARGDAHFGSDVDLLFLVPGSELKKRYFYFQQVLIEVFLLGEDFAKEKLEREKLEKPEANLQLVRVLSESEVIEDETGRFLDLISSAKERRTLGRVGIRGRETLSQAYMAETLHYIKKLGHHLGDPALASYLSGLLVQKAIETFYAYRGYFPVPPQKIFEDLDSRDPGFARLVRGFLTAETSEKLSIAVDLANRAFGDEPPIPRFSNFQEVENS